MNSRYLEVGFFLTLLIGVIFFTFNIIGPFFTPLVLALVLSVVFYPLYEFIKKVFRFQFISAGITVLLVVFLVLVPLSFLGLKIFEQATDLYIELSANEGSVLINFLKDRFSSLIFKLNLPQIYTLDLNSYVKEVLTWLISNLGPLFSGLAQVALTLFLSLFSMFYLLKDGHKFKDYIVNLMPLQDRYAEKVIDRMHHAVSSVMIGTMAVAAIQGLIAGLGFHFFGVPNATLWGTLAGVTALIPTFGTSLVMVPAIIYLFFTAPISSVIGLAIWAALAVGLIDNMMAPQVMRYGIKIHPLLILLSVLGGITLMGPIGFIVGPLTIALLFALLEIYPDIILHRHRS